MRLSEDLKIGGTLQWKVLATCIEDPLSGVDIMRRLGLSSPGTIYPVLKTLREKGLIEDAPEQGPDERAYILSKDGVRELERIPVKRRDDVKDDLADLMRGIRIIALNVETCPIRSKHPTHTDYILGISVHSTSSLHTHSTCQNKQFIIRDLSYKAEDEVIRQFLEFLDDKRDAILTAYDLVGCALHLLLSRSKEHYPLASQLLDSIFNFSLYDTGIAYHMYNLNSKNCKFYSAISELKVSGYDCFLQDYENPLSERDSINLWAKQRAGVSDEFSAYVSEHSHNHMRIAQILLKSNIKHGLLLLPHFGNSVETRLKKVT